MEIDIRLTKKEDLPLITEIYQDHVLNGLASFESEPPTLEEMTERFIKIQKANCPYFVATIDNAISGYSYAAPFHSRYAYRGTVENSIYLSPKAQGHGIGNRLLSALIDECTTRGFRQMIAIITKLNPPVSIHLHEKHGFYEAGVLRNVGYKKDRWLDVVYMQRSLGEGGNTPL